MWKQYGYVAMGTYGVVYLTTLTTMVALVSMGVDVKGFATAVGLGNLIDLNSLDPKAGAFVMGFIATKFTSPIRLPIVVFLTPRAARLVARFRGQ